MTASDNNALKFSQTSSYDDAEIFHKMGQPAVRERFR